MHRQMTRTLPEIGFPDECDPTVRRQLESTKFDIRVAPACQTHTAVYEYSPRQRYSELGFVP